MIALRDEHVPNDKEIDLTEFGISLEKVFYQVEVTFAARSRVALIELVELVPEW